MPGFMIPGMRQPGDGQGEIHDSSSVSFILMETRMADVIRLGDRTPRTPRKSTSDQVQNNKAVILLFTGIRYERLDGQTGGPAKTPFQGSGSRKKH